MTDRMAALETLLRQAESAHGVYESTELGGVYDDAWPRWYAGWLVNNGLADALGRAITSDVLADFLTSSWDEIKASDPKPTEPWAVVMARQIADKL